MNTLKENLESLERDGKYQRIEENPFSLTWLPRDLLKLLSDYLDILSFYRFMQTSKKCMTLFEDDQAHLHRKMISFCIEIQEKANERIFNLLYSYPDGLGKKIIEFLNSTHSVIGGGYVLQCITNDVYDNCTINIYVPDNEYYYRIYSNPNAIRMWLLRNHFDIPRKIEFETEDTHNHLMRIVFIFKVTFKTITMRFLFINLSNKNSLMRSVSPVNNNVYSFVKYNLALTFCACWFNGKSISSCNILDQYKKIGMMRDGNLQRAINNERDEEKIHCIKTRLTAIIEKYESRGFVIKNASDFRV
jgi:hypothetical protein